MIERFAGLKDNQEYIITVYNPKTQKTVKGIKITGRELEALSNALNALVQQQLAIDGITQRDQEVREEYHQEIAPPDEGANPLIERSGEFGGYEEHSTFDRPPEQKQDFGPNQPTRAITDNPDNVKPPRLP